MPLIAAIVDVGSLVDSVLAALVSAILFTLVVSVSIRGAARYVDYGSEGRGVAAALSLTLSIFFGFIGFALVAAGLYLLIST